MRKLLVMLLLSYVSLVAFESATMYKLCTVCHGKHGELSYAKKSPILVNLSQDDLASRLLNIKNGSSALSKTFVKMHEIKLQKLQEENVQEFAKYIGSLKNDLK